MHKIKSKAKQAAWIRDEGGQYNPFGKFGRGQSFVQSPSQSRVNSMDPEKALDVPATQPSRSPDAVETEEHSSNNEDSPTSESQINPAVRQRTKGSQRSASKTPSQNDEDDSKKKHNFTLWGQFRVVVFGSWINILLVCVPVGIAIANVPSVNRIAVFVINFLAIMPLAGILSYSTEEISMRVGETLGGLLNASFGNAVELIVSIIALVQGEIIIVQTSLIGSMLSNLLLVLGMCFFLGGINRPHQNFNITVAQTASSLLALAVSSLIIPTVFADWGSASTPEYRETKIPALSRGVSVILLLVYGAYLFFQLKTHSAIYNEKSEKVSKRKHSKEDRSFVQKGLGAVGIRTGAHAGGPLLGPNDFSPQVENNSDEEEKNDAEEEEVPQLSVIGAIVALCISTALVGVCAEYMVSAIAAVTKTGGISPEFVGLILIPIVGNAAEHATAVTVAIKDKMDLAIGVAVGSSMQIALLVLPLVVIIGWIIGNDQMSLQFDGFLIALLFITVLLVNYLIADGRSHWLEGILLISTYVIIAVAAYLYPESNDVVG